MEANRVVCSKLASEKGVELVVRDKAAAEGNATLEPEGEGSGHLRAVFATAIAGTRQRRLDSEQAVEDPAAGERIDLPGGSTGGNKCADERAHAGTGDAIDGNMVVVHPFHDAYVREA